MSELSRKELFVRWNMYKRITDCYIVSWLGISDEAVGDSSVSLVDEFFAFGWDFSGFFPRNDWRYPGVWWRWSRRKSFTSSKQYASVAGRDKEVRDRRLETNEGAYRHRVFELLEVDVVPSWNIVRTCLVRVQSKDGPIHWGLSLSTETSCQLEHEGKYLVDFDSTSDRENHSTRTDRREILTSVWTMQRSRRVLPESNARLKIGYEEVNIDASDRNP